jgi:hybrid cluster-associated redox disulfide protein
MVISKGMLINEVVSRYPNTVSVFRYYDMGCFGCAAARFESVEQGAFAHGIDLDALLVELNKRA